MDEHNYIVAEWQELKLIIKSLELDIAKNCMDNNLSAGKRARKGFRQIKKLATSLTKLTLSRDKKVKGIRRPKTS